MGRFYKIDTQGKHWLERLAGPGWVAADEARIIYDTVAKKIYYADDSAFQELVNTGDIANFIEATDVTYGNLNANADVGTGATQVSRGNHTHTGLLTPGYSVRAKFAWVNDDRISLRLGALYHQDGAAERYVENTAAITFIFGPGGSNATSDAVAAGAWNYLYVDDSALSSDIITASDLRNDNTGPAWAGPNKHAWYRGSDRCVGAFLADPLSDLIEFQHDGGDLIQWDRDISLYSANPGTLFSTTVSMLLPNFSQTALVTFAPWRIADVLPAQSVYWRTTGSSTPDGHLVGRNKDNVSGDNDQNTTVTQIPVFTDASGQIDIRTDINDIHSQIQLWQNGYYLPRGM
jgi:hypothetical protein